MPERRSILRIIGLVLGLGLFTWVALDLYGRAQTTQWPPLPANELVIATLLVLLAHGLHGLAWAVGARHYAPRLGWAEAIAFYSVSFLARYIPGKIWQIGGLSILTRDKGGNPLHIAGYSLAFLIAFQALGAMTMAAAYFARSEHYSLLVTSLAVPVLAVMLTAPYYLVGNRLLDFLPASIAQKLTGAFDQPPLRVVVNLTLLGSVWILLGTSGYVLINGFAPDWNGTWSDSTVAVIGGLVAGFVVLIAPSGAGVREATISLWLTDMGVLPVAAIAIVVALRIVMTVGELIWAAAGMLIALRNTSN